MSIMLHSLRHSIDPISRKVSPCTLHLLLPYNLNPLIRDSLKLSKFSLFSAMYQIGVESYD